ncbi:MAG: hypothetical protein IT290_04850, partial [Deltaproteobacteria bacterium]|nr:hypothetical protein [Deltaproteobacteria bacterium]
AQFLIIAADLDRSEVSGCSIDALHRTVTELSGRFGVQLVTPRDVVYRRGNDWVRVPRAEFATLAKSGEVDLTTPVLDATVIHLDQVRAGRWRPAASESWHKAAFFS